MPSTHTRRSSWAVLVIALAPLAVAQHQPPTAVDGPHWQAGQLVAHGPGYRAEFGTGALRYADTRARGNGSVRLALRAIGRGTERSPVGKPQRHIDGHVITDRYDEVQQRWTLRDDGVELSYVWQQRPSGSGDLVVELQVDSDIALASAGTDGVSFGRPGAGVTIGAVTGVDAGGQTVRGALRLSGDVLELSLPGTFVDHAQLPLVLDPLIGGNITVLVGGRFSTVSGGAIDVAYDRASERFMTVWQEYVFGAELGPWPAGALVTSDGTVANQMTLLGGGTLYGWDTQVANIASNGRFVATYVGGWGFYCIYPVWVVADVIDPASGRSVGSRPLAGRTDNHAFPDIAGDITPDGEDAIVVYQNLTQRLLKAIRVRVPTTGAPTPLLTVDLPSYGQRPAISRTGGLVSRYLVVWEKGTDIEGVVIDRNLRVLAGPTAIADSSHGELRPDVDGDGTDWLVAYERTAPGISTSDVYCVGAEVR